jgi:hypothetical protein
MLAENLWPLKLLKNKTQRLKYNSSEVAVLGARINKATAMRNLYTFFRFDDNKL